MNNPKQEAEPPVAMWQLLALSKDLTKDIDTHTTKLLNEQLGRLSEQSVYGHLAVPDCTQFIPLTAIENERKK